MADINKAYEKFEDILKYYSSNTSECFKDCIHIANSNGENGVNGLRKQGFKLTLAAITFEDSLHLSYEKDNYDKAIDIFLYPDLRAIKVILLGFNPNYKNEEFNKIFKCTENRVQDKFCDFIESIPKIETKGNTFKIMSSANLNSKVFKVKGAYVQCTNEQEALQLSKLTNLATSMQEVLEHTRLLEATSRMFHWNVVGSDFKRLHILFEDEYKQFIDDIDVIAEQIRQIGYFVESSSLPAVDSLKDGKNQLVTYKRLLERNIEIIKKAIEESCNVNDKNTEDVLIGISKNRSKSLYFVKSLLSGDLNDEQKVTSAATEITAGYDKLKFKEIKERPEFFKNLKEFCNITYSKFKIVNRGLRLAIKVIEEKYPEASIRYFLKKGSDGYIRVELEDNVYIIGYTIYDSGKVKVWTRQLKRNLPVNNFDITMLDLLAHKKGTTKLPPSIMPIWVSL